MGELVGWRLDFAEGVHGEDRPNQATQKAIERAGVKQGPMYKAGASAKQFCYVQLWLATQ